MNKFFLFLYIDIVYHLNLKQFKIIKLKNSDKLQELIERQYELISKDGLEISSKIKYVAFRLLGPAFTDSHVELLIEKFPNTQFLDFLGTEKIKNPLGVIPPLKGLNLYCIPLPKNFCFVEESQLEYLSLYDIDLTHLPSLKNFKKLKH